MLNDEKKQPITHATSNLGIRPNGKIGLVFGRFGKSE